MSKIVEETICEECQQNDDAETPYCPNCGAGPDPWLERPKFDWDKNVDLPIVFSVEMYDDHYKMWHNFTDCVFGQYELRESEIANVPDDLPRMKYCVVELWWKLDDSLELHGPFLEKQEAREA